MKKLYELFTLEEDNTKRKRILLMNKMVKAALRISSMVFKRRDRLRTMKKVRNRQQELLVSKIMKVDYWEEI